MNEWYTYDVYSLIIEEFFLAKSLINPRVLFMEGYVFK